MAGRVRLELTTYRLTADCSTIELPTHSARFYTFFRAYVTCKQ